MLPADCAWSQLVSDLEFDRVVLRPRRLKSCESTVCRVHTIHSAPPTPDAEKMQALTPNLHLSCPMHRSRPSLSLVAPCCWDVCPPPPLRAASLMCLPLPVSQRCGSTLKCSPMRGTMQCRQHGAGQYSTVQFRAVQSSVTLAEPWLRTTSTVPDTYCEEPTDHDAWHLSRTDVRIRHDDRPLHLWYLEHHRLLLGSQCVLYPLHHWIYHRLLPCLWRWWCGAVGCSQQGRLPTIQWSVCFFGFSWVFWTPYFHVYNVVYAVCMC